MTPVIDGIGILVAGILLITPGLLTDALGLLLFIPPVRRGLGRWVFQARDGERQRAYSRPRGPGETRRHARPGPGPGRRRNPARRRTPREVSSARATWWTPSSRPSSPREQERQRPIPPTRGSRRPLAGRELAVMRAAGRSAVFPAAAYMVLDKAEESPHVAGRHCLPRLSC